MVEQFNSECERIVGINLDSFTKSVTDFEDLVTPKYKAVLRIFTHSYLKQKMRFSFSLKSLILCIKQSILCQMLLRLIKAMMTEVIT